MLTSDRDKLLSSLFIQASVLTDDSVKSLVTHKKMVLVPAVFKKMIECRDIEFDDKIMSRDGGIHNLMMDTLQGILIGANIGEFISVDVASARYQIFSEMADYFMT